MITFMDLRGEGFRSFAAPFQVDLEKRGTVIVLGMNEDSDAADSNGTGKTTLFSALTWCLYGTDIDGKTTDVLHRGPRAPKKGCSVSVDFLTDDDRGYRVTRTRKGRGGDLKLLEWTSEDEPTDLTRVTAKDTQEAVEALLGMSWDVFRSTVIFGQGDRARFASSDVGDAARKEILGQVLGLNVYDAARQKAREGAKELQDAIRDLDATARETEREQAALDVKEASLQAKVEAVESLILRGEDDASNAIAEAAEAVAAAEAAAAEANDCSEDLIDAEEARDRIEALVAKRRAAKEEARDAARDAQAEVARATRSLAAARDAGPCPECGTDRPHDEDHEKSAEAALAQAKEAAGEAKAFQAKAEAVLAKAEAALTDVLKEHRSLADGVREARAKEKAEERRAKDATARAAKIRADIDAADSELAKLKLALSNLDLERDGLDVTLDSLAAQKADLVQRETDIQWWVRGLGPKGIPAFAIEQALPAINAATNEHLLVLADGDISVCWSATTPTADGKGEKEEMNCEVVIEGIPGARPSGGQRRKIDLASEMALAQLGASGGANLLLLDEALDGLDAEGAARVAAWLETLDRSSVFVVSHSAVVLDTHTTALVITKSGGASEITEGGEA